MNAASSQDSSDLQFNRTAWLAVVASILLVCASLAATIYRWSLPSDGWVREESLEDLSILLTRKFLDAPEGQTPPEGSRLQPGDRLLAVEGQPVDIFTLHLTPTPNWRLGGSLSYTVARDGNTLEVSVPLVPIPPGQLLSLPLKALPDIFGLLTFVGISIFVFTRRPGSLAAQVLLFLAAVRLAMLIANLLDADAPSMFGAPYWIDLWNFFRTWVWAGFLFPSLLLFTLVFPRPKHFVQRHPVWLLAGLYGLLHLLRLVIGDYWQIGWGLVSVFGLLSIASLVHSYVSLRRDPVAMAQTRWVLSALILTVAYPALTNIFIVSADPSDTASLLYQPVINAINNTIYFFIFLLLPIALAVAILRYRLFDIDIIIRRTLQYSLLTALLAAFYFGSVTVLHEVFTALGGSQTTAATVISTLSIAALFNPLRRRIQGFIDRRFYRQKYDAEHTLAEFAAAARNETEVGTITGDLLGAVQSALQPAQVSLWMQSPAPHREEKT